MPFRSKLKQEKQCFNGKNVFNLQWKNQESLERPLGRSSYLHLLKLVWKHSKMCEKKRFAKRLRSLEQDSVVTWISEVILHQTGHLAFPGHPQPNGCFLSRHTYVQKTIRSWGSSSHCDVAKRYAATFFKILICFVELHQWSPSMEP